MINKTTFIKGFYLLLLFLPLLVTAQNYEPTANGEVVKHSFYSLSYIEQYEQAEWVYYKLTSYMVNGSASRTDNFRPDPSVSLTSAQLSDYKGSGYDRGHLAPAADMKHSKSAMSESFYMSNMSPQNPSFNRGGWKNLESVVRNWAKEYETIYVVTGGVLGGSMNSIGGNGVSVPSNFYKVIYAPSANKMIAIVMPNEKITSSLETYVVSTDRVESLTGIDFFPQLDDDIEDKLEASTSTTGFTFTQFKGSSSSSSGSTSIQCKGTASSSGQRCKNKTTSSNGYCHVHQKQAPDYVAPPKGNYVGRCCAKTQKGTQCKRNATGGTRYCWQHQ